MEDFIKRILAVVVVYHPDINDLLSDVSSFIGHVGHLLVYLNSEDVPEDVFSAYENKITILGTGKCNVGLSGALNEAVKWGVAHGYEYLLTMDQDSRWVDIQSHLDEIEKCGDDRIAIFAPYVIGYPSVNSPREVITSGAVIRLSVLKEAGLFNESYFIDSVDHEMCYRVRKLGYKIMAPTNGKLEHKIGYVTRIGNTKYHAENYSPMRYYYSTKNSIWIKKQYGHIDTDPGLYSIHAIIIRPVHRIKIIILGEKNKLRKISSIVSGFFAGLFSRPSEIEFL